jgi:prepilin-type processing-associated H-X9-DG protein
MIAHSRSRAGLTLIQLIELIAITGLLSAFLFPIVTDFHEHGCPPTCIGQLKQLGVAMMMYAQDYDECYPSSRPDPRNDWSVDVRNADGLSIQHLHNSSPWVAQLLPYIKNPGVIHCPQDTNSERNHSSVSVPGSATPFPVSYGPNRLFVDPSAYGGKRPVSQVSVVRPEDRYLLADCVTASGFDMDNIAYVRYPNYDPALRQNGWSLDQFTAMGRVAWPDQQVASVTRHALGSNIMFADGHVHWLRHDQIPNNDGPSGKQYRKLREKIIPWQPVAGDP